MRMQNHAPPIVLIMGSYIKRSTISITLSSAYFGAGQTTIGDRLITS